MNNFNKIGIQGNVSIELYSSDGALIHSATRKNIVTDGGKELLARKMIGDTETISAIGIGSGDTPATVGDTTLENSLAQTDVRFQSTENNIASFISTFEENVPEEQVTVKEVGLFSDNNNLLVCRTILDTPFVKATTDYLVINWKLQIG